MGQGKELLSIELSNLLLLRCTVGRALAAGRAAISVKGGGALAVVMAAFI